MPLHACNTSMSIVFQRKICRGSLIQLVTKNIHAVNFGLWPMTSMIPMTISRMIIKTENPIARPIAEIGSSRSDKTMAPMRAAILGTMKKLLEPR